MRAIWLLLAALTITTGCGDSAAPDDDGGGRDASVDAPMVDGGLDATRDAGGDAAAPDVGADASRPMLLGYDCMSTVGSYPQTIRVGDGADTIRVALRLAIDNGGTTVRIVVPAGHDEGSLRGDLGAFVDALVTSEVPYQARIDNIDLSGGDIAQNITFEGFEIGPASGIVIKLDGGRTTNENIHHVTFRNNVLHESGSSDIAKINAGSNEIRLEWNMFYGHRDDALDLNSVEQVYVDNNVFFDVGGSFRNFVVIKDSTPVGEPDFYESTRFAYVRGNVFFGWGGGGNSAMLSLGEDNNRSAYAVQTAVVENNLFIGDGTLGGGFVAPISMRGVRDIAVRHNTFTGAFEGGRSWGFLAWAITSPELLRTEDIFIYNNLWASDGVGTSRFSKSDAGLVGAFVLDNNLYWNGGGALPRDGDQGVIDPEGDTAAIRDDPGLPSVGTLALPRWDRGTNLFADGSQTICEVRARMIDAYAVPTVSAAVEDRGRTFDPPAGTESVGLPMSRDLRGNERAGAPDLGAIEISR